MVEKQPKLVVEAGCFDGKNTKKLVELMKDIPFTLYCVSDNLPDRDLQLYLPKENGTFKWIHGISYNVFATFESKSIDFLFIDTDHNYWTMREELCTAHAKMKPGGIICMHDTQTYRKNSGKANNYGTGDKYPDEFITEYEKMGKGMGDAIWEFLAERPEYIVRKQVAESHGAMALEKLCV